MSFVTDFNQSKTDTLVVTLSTEDGNHPKKIPLYFLTYYLNLWESKWLLYAVCTTAKDIDFFIVHMHHSLFEAHRVKLKGYDCRFLANKEKKQNVNPWTIGFWRLLQNQVVISIFYAFCLAFCTCLWLYILGWWGCLVVLLENSLTLKACWLWLTAVNIQSDISLTSQSYWTLNCHFPHTTY